MKYTESFETKWHDTDAERRVRPSEILVYMQETANRQIDSTGTSLDDIRDKQRLAFILSKIKLVFHKPLAAYERIDVSTWTCESRGYKFNRCFDIRREGELVAEGISEWALINLDSRMLVRCDGVDLGIEPDEILKIDMPRRIKQPDAELSVLGTRPIRYSDIDYNMHMNNTKYPNMICDFMPIEQVDKIRVMTLEFLHESALGDMLTVYGCGDEGRYYFKTLNGKGDICLTAEVLTDK
ncbi:MAG: hypothetical protein IJ038_01980 [Clostridia bacterium]|nr:hypothetical protein [Clostridia bacterium]